MKLKAQDLTFIGLMLASLLLVDNLYVRTIIIVALLAWLVMEFCERRLLSEISDDETIICCEWSTRLNATDFLAKKERTISCLKDIGKNLDSALGIEYVFHPENSQGKNIYFPGKIQRATDGAIIIRADSERDLQGNTC